LWAGLGEGHKDRPEYRKLAAHAYARLGDVRAALKQFQDAEQAYDQSLALRQPLLDPENQQALGHLYFARARLFEAAGRLPEAAAAWRQAADVFGPLADRTNAPFHRQEEGYSHLNLGSVLARAGDHRRAEEPLRRAVAIHKELTRDFPNEALYRERLAHSLAALAECLVQQGKHADAAAAFDDLRGASPGGWNDYYRAGYQLARCAALAEKDAKLSEDERKAAARKYADRARALLREAVERLPNDPEEQNNLAWNLVLSPHTIGLDPDLTRALATKAAAAAPKAPPSDIPRVADYWGRLALTRQGLARVLKEAGRPREADESLRASLACCREAAELAPHHLDTLTSLHSLARGYRDAGRLAEARPLFEEALRRVKPKLGPDHADKLAATGNWRVVARAQRAVGGLLHTLGRAKEAEQVYREARACWEKRHAANPGGHDRWELAWFLVICPDPGVRDPGRALELARKAPRNGLWWRVLGAAHLRAGDWPAAIAALEKADQLAGGGGAWEWFFLAMAHWRQGDQEAARTWYDRGLQHMEECRGHPDIEEVHQFQAEAAALLGVKDR
jgi:tetratricopeptide (TPR) repeat protein